MTPEPYPWWQGGRASQVWPSRTVTGAYGVLVPPPAPRKPPSVPVLEIVKATGEHSPVDAAEAMPDVAEPQADTDHVSTMVATTITDIDGAVWVARSLVVAVAVAYCCVST